MEKITPKLEFSGGSSELCEENIITAVEFDPSGEYVATGNRSGRIVLYKKSDGAAAGAMTPHPDSWSPPAPPTHARGPHLSTAAPKNSRKSATRQVAASNAHCNVSSGPPSWSVMHQFVSHETEFDYLKSIEVSPNINKIRFCTPPGSGGAPCLLATNEKCIRLWKISPTRHSFLPNAVASYCEGKTATHLTLPTRTKLLEHSARATAMSRRVFKNAHIYHINSIDISCDGETFLSADDLRINLWALDRADTCINIIDTKPDNMEDLAEVITSATFNPTSSHLLAYSTSKGTIKLGDLRQSCLCTSYAKVFGHEEDQTTKSFFSEIIASISDITYELIDTAASASFCIPLPLLNSHLSFNNSVSLSLFPATHQLHKRWHVFQYERLHVCPALGFAYGEEGRQGYQHSRVPATASSRAV